MQTNEGFRKIEIKTQLCVIGGGLAGMIAAISAARHGTKVVLIHDRPVLGGNASSEIRMWALGAHGTNMRETGIFEEILLENMYRNPERNFSLWDSVLYEKAKFEPNITLLLNCSCCDCETKKSRIIAVTGWQLTTYTFIHVTADLFADCSGDSVLAPLCGADFRMGRESRDEFGEDIAPITADKRTMGMTCLMQARETDRPVKFIPPAWANKYTSPDEFKYRYPVVKGQNFWWMELGGEQDTIHDTEDIKHELLKLALGVWDYMKNYSAEDTANWDLEFLSFLPGKRESRRYLGDHILTQNEVRAEGKFDDLVAYGGWPMDDHNPGGFLYKGEPTIYHPAPSPFGIPYRSLYSRNVDNLFFAGRNISTTHTAMSSSRVMATCAIVGQAVGTAAAIAAANGLSPRGVYQDKIAELQQTLMEDDCYLPWHQHEVSPLCKQAELRAEGDAETLRSGYDRPIGETSNLYIGQLGKAIDYVLPKTEQLHNVRLVLDSDLNRETVTGVKMFADKPMPCGYFLHMPPFGFPKTMLKAFIIQCFDEQGEPVYEKTVENNYQRLVKLPLNSKAKTVRLIPKETWGSEQARIFAFEVD